MVALVRRWGIVRIIKVLMFSSIRRIAAATAVTTASQTRKAFTAA
jgi:hypothetical protein